MKRSATFSSQQSWNRHTSKRPGNCRRRDNSRPAAAYRRRGGTGHNSQPFYATENWYDATDRPGPQYLSQRAGDGYIHPVTVDEIRERIASLPAQFTQPIEVIQLSRMTRKRALFPCYGMQWGPNIYLYPIEESLVEVYVRAPKPQQLIEAKMYGGRWSQQGNQWHLMWTAETIRDFYLNNVLVHEIGHVNDERNRSFESRERYANWFAIEYGYRPTRKQ